MPDFLLELLSEEIPARMQAGAAEELKRQALAGLTEAGLAWGDAAAYVTPRRLALRVDGLPARQPDTVDERRGPKVGAPQQAIDGFVRAAGLGSISEATVRETDKGPIYFATTRRPGRDTAEVLADIVRRALIQFAWPKSMRWGEGRLRWVRPLQSVLAVFDGATLPGSAAPEGEADLAFTDRTQGHRFLAPEPFAVTGFADYEAGLRRARVLLDREARKSEILAQAERLAAAEGLRLRRDPGLLEEVAGLVEWPVVLTGRIDDEFMAVPPEVLTTSMRSHQRYFSLETSDGALAPRFLVVANTETSDGGRAVVAGNERVLRARLSDARFFWDQDRRQPLESRVAALGEIVFHAKLGTMLQKVERLRRLAVAVAALVEGAETQAVERAALLAKADLTSGMVGEFPELQGVMGRYYALEQQEDPEVADAIAQHYAPLGPSDRCPRDPTAVAVALADKIDTLVGFFAVDEKPTGSRDPYALRRASLGAIRLILENGLRVPLTEIFAASLALYRDSLAAVASTVILDLSAFFADRLKVALRDRGVRHDLIDAVFALGGEDDLVRLIARVDAIRDFLATPDGGDLLVAYRRAANIVRIEEKRDGVSYARPVDRALLRDAEERALAEALAGVRDVLSGHLEREAFGEAMAALASLRPVVDRFFDKVTVNADDPGLRANRLALLTEITAVMDRVAAFSRVEG